MVFGALLNDTHRFIAIPRMSRKYVIEGIANVHQE